MSTKPYENAGGIAVIPVLMPLIRKTAMQFYTQEALDKYLAEHPDADRSKHYVLNVRLEKPGDRDLSKFYPHSKKNPEKTENPRPNSPTEERVEREEHAKTKERKKHNKGLSFPQKIHINNWMLR